MTDPRGARRLAFVTAALAVTPVAMGSAEPPGQAEGRPSTTTTMTMLVPGAAAEVFELFTPLRRSKWDPEWNVEITTPGRERRDGPGSVFRRLDQPDITWKVTALDLDERIIELESVRPGYYDLAVDIVCMASDADHTSVEVTYTAVAHSDRIHEALQSSLAHQIENTLIGENGWRDLLTHFLRNGTRFEPFEPVAIERRHTARFDAPPDRVFALTNPADGNHWTPATPRYVFGSAEQPSGAMWRRRHAWYLVAEHDPIARSMKTVLFIPETEFMMEEVRCDPTPGGGTTMTVTWRVAGLPPSGNEAVQTFFDQHWDRRMAMLEESYRIQLQREVSSQ